MKRIPILLSVFLTVTLAGLLIGQISGFGASLDDANQSRAMAGLKNEVWHELLTLPYYSVFDWFEADVQPDGKVVLAGQATTPTLKKDAESRVKKLEGVNQVVNNIEVLPLSNFDDELRSKIYRSIYRFDSP